MAMLNNQMVCWSSMDVWHLQILWLIFLVIAHVMLLSLARALDFPKRVDGDTQMCAKKRDESHILW